MTSPRGARVLAGVLAGALVFVLTFLPSALIVAAITIGALGEIEYARLGPASVLLFVAIGAAIGIGVYRGLGRAWSEPDRRPADVWIAYVVALTVLVVGVIVIPILVVFIAVDSDHSLADRALLVEILWFGGHIALGAVAYWVGRRLFNTRRPDSVGSLPITQQS